MSLIRDDDDPRAVLAATCVLAVTLLAAAFGCFGAVAHAQESVVREVKAGLEVQGVSLQGSCNAFRITHAVAERLGFKLLRKVPGQNRVAFRPDGTCEGGSGGSLPGYAVDYVIAPSTCFGYDILIDEGGSNGPTWREENLTNAPTEVARNCRPDNQADPVALGVPTPDPTPDPPADLVARLAALEAQARELHAWGLELQATVTGLGMLHEEVVSQIEILNQQIRELTNRPIPTGCRASVFGIRVGCQLVP